MPDQSLKTCSSNCPLEACQLPHQRNFPERKERTYVNPRVTKEAYGDR